MDLRLMKTMKRDLCCICESFLFGPLLFLIFINDITHVIRRCKIRLFADDTCLFIEVDEPAEAAEILNDNLSRIQEWANKWLATFSPPKIAANKQQSPTKPPATIP